MRATYLLDQVLQLPPDLRQEAALRLGEDHHVRHELERLLRGTRTSSVLDEPLERLLRQLLGKPRMKQ